MEIAEYRLTFNGLRERQEPGVRIVEAQLAVEAGRELVGTLITDKRFYRGFERQPSTSVGIRTTPMDDLYVVMAGWEADGSASFMVFVNPLVIWIWLGGIVAVAGRADRDVAADRGPGGLGRRIGARPRGRAGVTAWRRLLTACFVLAVLFAAVARVAQADPLDDETRRIGKQLQCPVCSGASVADSPSDLAGQMRGVIRAKLEAGESEQQIVAYFVERYGDSVLIEPPRRGVGLLVWIAPVGDAGGRGAVAVAAAPELAAAPPIAGRRCRRHPETPLPQRDGPRADDSPSQSA